MKDIIKKLNAIHKFVFCDKRPTIALKDNRTDSKYIATNESSKCIAHYQVDKGLMKDIPLKKCDHLLLVDDAECSWYFIELKDGAVIEYGKPNKKLQDGIEQIESAIQYMRSQKWLKPSSRIESRIVGRRVPDIDSSKSNYRPLEKKYKSIGLKFKQRENL